MRNDTAARYDEHGATHSGAKRVVVGMLASSHRIVRVASPPSDSSRDRDERAGAHQVAHVSFTSVSAPVAHADELVTPGRSGMQVGRVLVRRMLR